jgi:apolipoprotein N-acyltransferase
LRNLFGKTFLQAALGSALLFAALPPLSIWPLGWVAPIPWLLLIGRAELSGKRPYLQIYAAGILFWLLALHWLRLPHPATSIGWIAVAFYMGCYLPLLVALGRVGVHTLKAPLWVAAPVVWTGLELVRGHLLTGFLMASIAHTQLRWPAVLQIADLGGEYAVCFVIVLVAACLAAGWHALSLRRAWTAVALLAPAALLLAAALAYGYWRLGEDVCVSGPRVALIQGNALAEWKADSNHAERIMSEYTQLSVNAVRAAKTSGNGRAADLVVWPETMFRGTIFQFESGYKPTPDRDDLAVKRYEQAGPAQISRLVEQLGTPVLLGVDVIEFLAAALSGQRGYRAWNAAVLAGRDGQIVGRYDKVHLVMFGEYIPFARYVPWLYKLTPLAGGVTAGVGAVALESDGVVYVPNICYESVLPHVIRRQVVELTESGAPPDVLVNLTNDAWYWGSSELDMHLACACLRAIETRKPHLVAANGGLSAQIDSCGRIVRKLPRQSPGFILADIELDPRTSVYTRIGDWPAGVCLATCLLLAIVGFRRSRVRPGK